MNRARVLLRLLLNYEGLDAFMPHHTTSVLKARQYVFSLKPCVTFENGLNVIASREHIEHVLDSQSPSANNRLAAEDLGIHDNTREPIRISHAIWSC
jgi:hypothetical protein